MHIKKKQRSIIMIPKLTKPIVILLDNMKRKYLGFPFGNPNRKSLTNRNNIRPVDSSIGSLRHLSICCYSGKSVELSANYLAIYADLLMKLIKYRPNQADPLEISVIASDHKMMREIQLLNAATQTLANLNTLIDNKCHLTYNVFKAKRDGLSIWIQDCFLALQNGDDAKPAIQLIENQKKSRTNNDQANSLKKCLQEKYKNGLFQLLKCNLNFIGGNILFVGDYALVGIDNLRGTTRDFFANQFCQLTNIAPENIIWIEDDPIIPRPNLNKANAFEQFTWMDLNSKQAIFHLDLFITPAGKDEFGRHRLVISEPMCKERQRLPILNYTQAQVEAIVRKLDEYPAFVIYRCPLPLTYADISKNGKKTRKWFFASYNNAIVQWEGHTENSCVWIPTYGTSLPTEKAKNHNNTLEFADHHTWLKEKDAEIKETWESMGFKVIELTNYLPLAIHRGSVHCITKTLYRNRIE